MRRQHRLNSTRQFHQTIWPVSPAVLFFFVIAYFALLLGVAWFTSRKSDNESFFIGNRKSNWMLVAFGMIGTSLSGVTFISVPGACFFIDKYQRVLFGSYEIGLKLLIINGAITFAGLWLASTEGSALTLPPITPSPSLPLPRGDKGTLEGKQREV